MSGPRVFATIPDRRLYTEAAAGIAAGIADGRIDAAAAAQAHAAIRNVDALRLPPPQMREYVSSMRATLAQFVAPERRAELLASETLGGYETAFELIGTPGEGLDRAVTHAVQIGGVASPNAAGRYRVEITAEQADSLHRWLDAHPEIEGVTLGHEQPPEGVRMVNRVLPAAAPRRRSTLHGTGDVARCVARAIDAGLSVTAEGLQRFEVSGPTAHFVAWVMDLFKVKRARALELLGIANEQAAADEDRGHTIPVQVEVKLPDRRTESTVERDARGDLKTVTHVETTIR